MPVILLWLLGTGGAIGLSRLVQAAEEWATAPTMPDADSSRELIATLRDMVSRCQLQGVALAEANALIGTLQSAMTSEPADVYGLRQAQVYGRIVRLCIDAGTTAAHAASSAARPPSSRSAWIVGGVLAAVVGGAIVWQARS